MSLTPALGLSSPDSAPISLDPRISPKASPKEAAQAFESLFASMILKHMRQPMQSGQGLFGTIYSVSLRIETLAQAVERATRPERIMLHPGRHSPRCLELLVPPEALDTFIGETDRRCTDWRIPLRSVELRRTAREEVSFLRWASRDFAQVKLNFSHCETLGAVVRSAQLRRELVDAAIAAGGRFHIASTLEATREQTEICYPQLKAFLAHKRHFDPQERLMNPWYLHQRSLFARPDCEVRWAH